MFLLSTCRYMVVLFRKHYHATSYQAAGCSLLWFSKIYLRSERKEVVCSVLKTFLLLPVFYPSFRHDGLAISVSRLLLKIKTEEIVTQARNGNGVTSLWPPRGCEAALPSFLLLLGKTSSPTPTNSTLLTSYADIQSSTPVTSK